MRVLTLITLALTLGGLHTACSSCGEKEVVVPKFPTGDAVGKLAKLPVGLEIEDSVDVKKNPIDYRAIVPDETGKAKLEVDFGDNHGLTGKVSVHRLDASQIVGESVTPAESEYTLEWEAKADETYIAVIEATKAKGNYKMELGITPPPPKDPCEDVSCDDDEECQAGKCISVKPAECSPRCKTGQTCVDGKCIAPCGGKCPTGQICNRQTNECVKDPCAGKTCPEGQRCSGGVCKDIPKATTCTPKCKSTQTCNTTTLKCEDKPGEPIGCNPPCGEGQKCEGSKCVDAGTAVVTTCGPVGAGVVQVVPNGAQSILILNKGAAQNVKVGQTGRIANVNGTFKITEVYPVRCKAIIDVDAATIGNNKSATIQREACP